MNTKFGQHSTLDSSDSALDGGSEFFFSWSGNSGSDNGIPSVPTPIEEAIQAQTALAQSGPGGPGSAIAVTSGGFTINLIFDSAAMAAPASFRAGIQQTAALLASAISDHISININIDYSGTGGGAPAGPDNGQWV